MTKNNITGFHHVCIKAEDFDQTVIFYQSLGFEKSHSWSLPQFNITRCTMMFNPIANIYIEICDKDSNMPTQGRKRLETEEHVESSILHLCFIVKDATLAYANALKKGAKPLSTLEEINLYDFKSKRSISVRNSLVYSPNGEVIEFIEKDPFKILR